jgi:hypothetical protein
MKASFKALICNKKKYLPLILYLEICVEFFLVVFVVFFYFLSRNNFFFCLFKEIAFLFFMKNLFLSFSLEKGSDVNQMPTDIKM